MAASSIDCQFLQLIKMLREDSMMQVKCLVNDAIKSPYKWESGEGAF